MRSDIQEIRRPVEDMYDRANAIVQQPRIKVGQTGRCMLVRCLSVLNVLFCKKSPKLAQMTFDRYLSNPDIGLTFWNGLTHSN